MKKQQASYLNAACHSRIVFGGLPNVGPVLDQMEEDVRLHENRLDGKLPTQGATKAVDGVDGDNLA